MLRWFLSCHLQLILQLVAFEGLYVCVHRMLSPWRGSSLTIRQLANMGMLCRAYDSSLDFPTATERHVYPVVLARQSLPTRSAIRALLPPSAFAPRIPDTAAATTAADAAADTGSPRIRSVPSG